MKVIAITSDEKFLVEATNDELIHIAGFAYKSEKDCPTIKFGMQISVSDMWAALHIARKSYDTINSLAKELHKKADEVVSINRILSNPFEEPK